MKKFLLGTSAAVLLAAPAVAADLAVKAPPMIAAAAPSWTGFYAGVGIGVRRSEADWRTTCLAPTFLGTATCPNDIFAGTTRINNDNPASFDSTGIRVGGYVGYNVQANNLVYGVEGDFAWGSNRQSHRGIPGTWSATFGPGTDTSSIRDTWEASIRGRLGVLIRPTVLVYATGGATWIHKDISVVCVGTFPAGWCNNPGGVSQSESDVLFGWTVGGGIEMMLTPNWIGRAEYRYSDYGGTTQTFLRNAGVPAGIDSFTFTVDQNTHVAYIGLARKF